MMSKTIRQALIDEIHYPVGIGFIDNKLMKRGLNGDDPVSADIMNSAPFIGAVADCLASLITAPNIKESDKSVGYSGDTTYILSRANALYRSIREPEVQLDAPKPKPKVTIL